MFDFIKGLCIITLIIAVYIVLFWGMVQVSSLLVTYALAYIAWFVVTFCLLVLLNYAHRKLRRYYA